MKRITFDPAVIDHTNEELMRHYFTNFAQEAGLARKAAELRFREVWETMRKRLSPDRNHTYQVLKEHI